MAEAVDYAGKLITIERFILDQQQAYPDATGTLTNILYDMALAAKIITSKTTRAGLAEILGSAGEENVQGEEVQKLDQFAQSTIFRLNDHTGRLAAMASEEVEGIIQIPEKYQLGKYVLLFDPLDGSSNIDFNVSIGTIFGIYRRKTESGHGTLEDVLQKGSDLVAAGYILYGSSTMMVYSTGSGVHGFTLDPAIGEFLSVSPEHSHPRQATLLQRQSGIPARIGPKVSRNMPAGSRAIRLRRAHFRSATLARWWRIFIATYWPVASSTTRPITRISSNLVASCGLSMRQRRWVSWLNRQGAMRLTVSSEFSTFSQRSLHQRVPLFVGDRKLVEKAEAFISEND